jgi:hypothetical protein
MNEALYTLPLLCMVVEDGYGRSCGFSWLIGTIVSKLEFEPQMCERKYNELRNPSLLYGEFSWLIGGPIVSRLERLEPQCDDPESSPREDGVLREALFLRLRYGERCRFFNNDRTLGNTLSRGSRVSTRVPAVLSRLGRARI